MANKRQRKKQQTSTNIKKLQQAGITSKKEIRELKNNKKAVEKIFRPVKRKQTAAERSNIIRSLGYKVSDHAPKRYWSEQRFNEWYQGELDKKERQRKKAERKQKDDNDLYLLIFWRDKTAEGFADTELIERYKYAYRYMDNEQLLSYINKYLRSPKPMGAEIGTTMCIAVKGSQRKQYINLMTNVSATSSLMADKNDWVLVYEGKARRYHDLLLAVHAVIRLLYDASERASFINSLIDKVLPRTNINMARRLAKDLGWRGFV